MKKCVLVIDKALPVGLVANTCAVLALSLGQRHPELVGRDLYDGEGDVHPGITTVVIPILGCAKEDISVLRMKARKQADEGLHVIDVSNIAQQTKTYEDYAGLLKDASPDSLEYLGVCLFGPADLIKSLTGSLPLLR